MAQRPTPWEFDVSAFEALPATPGLFVAGTGPKVGKTTIAAGICQALRRQGFRVEPFCPVATDCRRTLPRLVCDAADLLAAAAGTDRPLTDIVPLRFTSHLDPLTTALRAGAELDLEEMFQAYRLLARSCEVMVVDSPGGLCTPLRNDFWTVHLAKLLGLAVVLVVPPAGGALGETLMSLHVARSAGLEVAGVVINRYQAEPAADAIGDEDRTMAMHYNPALIRELGAVKVLATVPDDKLSSVREASIGPDVSFALNIVDWPRLAGLPEK